jgi:SP family xylose:H+ symportor-like MFS transporter
MKNNVKNNSSYNSSYIFGITLVATLGGLLFGYDTAVISGTVESLRKFFIEPFGWSLDHANAMEGFVVGSALIGCIIGAAVAGWVSQNYGRKPTLIMAAVLFLLSAVGSAWPEIFVGMPGSGNHSFLYAFVTYRILGGVGVGLASMVSPMYIAEVAPADRRGNLVSWNQFALIFGMLVVYFVNYFIALQGDASWLHNTGWRWMFASEIIPASLFFVLLFFVPETPRYLVMKGKTKKADIILNRLLGKVKAEIELSAIKESFKEKTPSMLPYFKFVTTWLIVFGVAYTLLKIAGVNIALEISLIGSFIVALFLPVLSFGARIIIVGVLLSAFQQFVGINVVLYYAPEIFKTMGAETDAALLQQIIVGSVNLSFTVLAILTVDKFGRRPLMIIGALVMAASMIILGSTFYTHSVGVGSLICMLVYTAGFAMSWGPVCWVLLAEIFPNSIRSMVMSIAVAAQWIANFLISWTFPMLDKNKYLTDVFNHGMAYWIYGLMGILAAVFIWKFVPESKGKTLEQMEQYWKKTK